MTSLVQYLTITCETVDMTGAARGDSVKTLKPTEIEGLALAFLGIEKNCWWVSYFGAVIISRYAAQSEKFLATKGEIPVMIH